jgi:Starch-binding associating with outer membrane
MKNMKRTITFLFALFFIVLWTSCDKGDLSQNPNAAGPNAIVNVSLLVNRIDNEIYNGGGVMDGYAANQSEGPWSQMMRWNQYFISNYSYYWGGNSYTWSNSSVSYNMLKYTVLMEQQIKKQGATLVNADVYRALTKFFRAYSFVWYSQRVGDIPMSEAGNPNIPTPKFDSQHDVFKNSLALLDTANTLLGGYIKSNPSVANTVMDGGDIYGLTYLQWQKVINSYKLRVLISLSKRALDAPDLDIPQQFAAIVNNPATYPVMTSNADNVNYKFNGAVNFYPIKVSGDTPYSVYANISNTYLNLTTATADPRTFIVATPAPAQLKAGKLVSDFTAYVGSDINTGQSTLLINSTNGMYSYTNYRYYKTGDGSSCEPYTIFGYPELCFNIAEGINRGWVTGTSATWYTNGINASMGIYGLTQGQSYPILDKGGASLGTVTIDINTFLTNVAYAGDNASGLTQILQQKYIAMFQSSGWEAYYNWRRTGVPAFGQGGPGIGTGNSLIPIRWLYANDEAVANSANYSAALQNQGFTKDDVNAVMWLIKP